MIQFEKIFVVYLFVLQILVIIRNILLNNYEVFFYVCDHISLLLAISFFYKKYNWIKALICVGLFVQVGWIIDLLIKFLFDFYLFGVTVYIFESTNYFSILVSVLIHSSTLILAFVLVRNKKTSRMVLIISLMYLFLIYFLTLFLTNPTNDINCVFNACNITILQFNYFKLLYLPMMFLFVILPTYYFQKYFSLNVQ